jgi:probable HAF family extracellular repeat protein
MAEIDRCGNHTHTPVLRTVDYLHKKVPMSHAPNALLRFCAAIGVMALLAVSAGHAGSLVRAAYRVRVLPLEFPFVTGFNDGQQVIGYAPQGLTTVGFLRDAKQGVQSIYPSGMYADNRGWAIPFDINKHGEVVGYRSIGPGSTSAFLRDRSGAVFDLGPFVANSLNDRGQVAGAAVLLNFESRAVLWTAGTGTTDLGGMNSRAIDINNRGVIAGDVQGQAAVWTDIGIWQELGILGDSPFGGPRFSSAHAVNDRGWVVGTSTAPTGGAFLWTPQTGMENLGDLHTGHDISLSHAVDINQHGTVIGESLGWIFFAGDYEMVPPRSFVWTRRTGMMALDDLIPAGWTISHVIAINDHEEILATAAHLNEAYTVVLEPVNGRLK